LAFLETNFATPVDQIKELLLENMRKEEENHEKRPTPVVGLKSNGKRQFKITTATKKERKMLCKHFKMTASPPMVNVRRAFALAISWQVDAAAPHFPIAITHSIPSGSSTSKLSGFKNKPTYFMEGE